MSFESHSQAGQDRFVREVLGADYIGSFLDIGANHPVDRSNTFALEQHMGWTGLCVENDANCVRLLREQRTAEIVDGDATRVTLKMKRDYDYLSLDVDESSEAALGHLLGIAGRFKVLTVEHDAYRFGEERRRRMVHLLRAAGYEILCGEVCDQGMSFEVWAVDQSLLTAHQGWRAQWFKRVGRVEWRTFFPAVPGSIL